MTLFTKFGTAALLVATCAAPAMALAPLRQVTIAGTVVGSIDHFAPRQESWAESYDNLPVNAGNSFFLRSHTSRGQGYDNNNLAISDALLNVGNSVMKAEIHAYASVSTNFPVIELASSSSSLSALNVDRVTFTGIAPGKKAIVVLSRYAEIGLSSAQGGFSNFAKSSNFSYSSDAVLYDNLAAVTAETIGSKFSSSFRVCDTLAACSGANYLKNGFRLLRTFLVVDNDDVLYITNNLTLGNSVAAYRSVPSYAYGEITQNNDFGHSGYTAIKALTAGVGYESASGEIYVDSLPHGLSAVPEPQSWALLIAGFGIVGGTMRNRRQSLAR